MTPDPHSSDALLASIKVIDADTHYTEPHDLWLRRAPSRMRDRVPQVKARGDDVAWVIDGDKSIGDHAFSFCSVLKDGSKAEGLMQMKMRIEEVHAGAYDLKSRLQKMDETGIWAQIVYPNLLGFGGQKAVMVEPELRLLCVQIYNDAMAEMQADSGQRLFPMALLPWWDVDQAVAETRRTHAMGLRGVNINSDPQSAPGLGLPDLAHDYWSPLWEACESLAMPVNFHIGASEVSVNWQGSAPWPTLPYLQRSCIGSVMLFIDNARVMSNLIMSGICDRFPKLRFVSVESGVGWIPFLLEALDYHYSELGAAGILQRRPSEYFRSNFHACFWFEQGGLSEVIQRVGVDNVLFETDFPHPTCLYPTSMTAVADALGGLDDASRRKALSGNAAKLYNIPLG